jgi:hypothetical protein
MGLILVYVLLCFICGYYGQGTRLGLWGVFLFSVLLTPIPILIILFFLKPDHEPKTDQKDFSVFKQPKSSKTPDALKSQKL